MYRKISAQLYRFLRMYWKNFAYYGCVLLVLCVLAYAADVYRQRAVQETAVIPAAELLENGGEADRPTLIMPTGASVLRQYCPEGQWNDVLCLWESHEAMDCSFENNCVLALGGGIITGIGSDACMGNYVEISDENLTVRYGSVKPDPDLRIGETLQAGGLIGETDFSMLREQYMQEHAHIEFILEGNKVDPAAFF